MVFFLYLITFHAVWRLHVFFLLRYGFLGLQSINCIGLAVTILTLKCHSSVCSPNELKRSLCRVIWLNQSGCLQHLSQNRVLMDRHFGVQQPVELCVCLGVHPIMICLCWYMLGCYSIRARRSEAGLHILHDKGEKLKQVEKLMASSLA